MSRKKKQKKRKTFTTETQKNELSQTVEMGFKYHQAGNLSEAERLYKKALTQNPNNFDAYHLLGIIANQTGANDLAVDLIQKALTINSKNDTALINLGVAFEKTARENQAIDSYKKAIALNPNSADACNKLANVFNNTGRLKDAIHWYNQAISLKPDIADTHNNLGVALEKANRLDEAIDSYNKALAINPESASTNNNLGNLLVKTSQNQDAISCYQKAISLEPNMVTAWNNLAIVFQNTGQLDDAIRCYKKAIALKPDYIDAYNNLGNGLEKKGLLDQAILVYQKAIALSPGNADLHNNLGITLKDVNRLDEAAESIKKAISLRPDFAEAYNNLGNILEKLHQSNKAIENYKKAISLQPEYTQAHCNLGIEFEKTGQMDKAVACFRKAISIKPDHIEAHRHLSKSIKHTHYDNDIAAMESLYKENKLSDSQRILLCFSLGKAFEDLKDFEKAFFFIKEANHLHRRSYTYDISKDQNKFSSIKKIFNQKFFHKHEQLGHYDKTPIFILGMPRSGTTLVEQILSSHPSVFGAGELKDLSLAGKNLILSEDTQQQSKYLSGPIKDEFKKIGVEYIKRIRNHSHTASFITDKMPHNFLHIGIIKIILPESKIIHCKRNPMDTCLSIFKNYFSEKNSHKYAYDLEELGQYYRLYLDLMAHWQETLPGFIHEIEYEQLISDQEKQTRKLLEFCHLTWDDTCMSFHQTKRKVSTASSVQVRQPIYNNSVLLWERYKNQLEPLRKKIYG